MSELIDDPFQIDPWPDPRAGRGRRARNRPGRARRPENHHPDPGRRNGAMDELFDGLAAVPAGEPAPPSRRQSPQRPPVRRIVLPDPLPESPADHLPAELVSVELLRPEPARAETMRAATGHAAPARPRPARAEPARAEPARPEPARPEPARPEPAPPEPAPPEPAPPELQLLAPEPPAPSPPAPTRPTRAARPAKPARAVRPVRSTPVEEQPVTPFPVPHQAGPPEPTPLPVPAPEPVRRPGRYPKLIAATVIVGALGGFAWGLLDPPDFAGRADFVVAATVDLTGGEATGTATDRDVATQAALLDNQAVRMAATNRLGWKDFSASVRSDPDSNVISVSVSAGTGDRAAAAVNAYARAYRQLVAAQQRVTIKNSITETKQAISYATKQEARLDDAVRQTRRADRDTLFSQQSSQRLSLAEDLRDNQQQLGRLKVAYGQLPVNVTALSSSVPIEPSGLALWQWTALGLVLGGAVGTVLSLRLAERRTPVPA